MAASAIAGGHMFRYLSLLAVLLLSLAGCASYQDATRERMAALPQHYVHFDAVLAWDVQGNDGQTVIDGVFKNVRYPVMYQVEIWVAALNAAGKTVARSVYLVGQEVRQDDAAAFRVKLPVPAVPGTRLRFTYKYAGFDGGGTDGGGDIQNWMQSFDAVIPPR